MSGTAKRALLQLVGLLCLLVFSISITGCGGVTLRTKFKDDVEVKKQQEKPAPSTFTWQNPLPTGNPIQDMSFVDDKTGWAVGAGTILKTMDGKTWQVQRMDSGDVTYYQVKAIDENTAMVFGSELVITHDGGRSWEPLGIPDGASLGDMQLVDNREIWMRNCNLSRSTLFKSNDFGESWRRTTFPEEYYVSGMCVLDRETILLNAVVFGYDLEDEIVAPRATLLVSEDGGKSWKTRGGGFSKTEKIKLDANESESELETSEGEVLNSDMFEDIGGPYSMTSVDALSNRYIWLGNSSSPIDYAYESTLYWTSNGGSSWKQKDLNCGYIRDVKADDKDVFWVVGDNGVIRTTDGGKTWEELYNTSSTNDDGVTDLEPIDDDLAYLSTKESGIMKTEDGGKTWEPQFSCVTHVDLHSISAIDDNVAWASGCYREDDSEYTPGRPEEGAILHTQDGGESWQVQATEANTFGIGVYAVDKDTAFASTGNGETMKVLKTIDGGINWIPIFSVEWEKFNLMSVVDSRNVWVACNKGEIIRTKDGGSTWTTRQFPRVNAYFDPDIDSLSALDSETAWAVEGFKLFKTTDGGKTWNLVHEFPEQRLLETEIGLPTEVVPINDRVLWVMLYAELFESTDGGQTWTELNPEVDEVEYFSLKGVMFTEAEHNIIVHLDDSIYETNDSGVSWTKQVVGVDDSLARESWAGTGLHGTVTENYIWLVGENGTILKAPRTLK